MAFARDEDVLEVAEADLLVRTDRAHVRVRRIDDAEVAVALEDDLAEEGAQELGPVPAVEHVRLAEIHVDARRRLAQVQGGGVLGLVVDAVRLDEADRAAVGADDEVLGRFLAAERRAIAGEIGIRLAGSVVPPLADVRLQEPALEEREVLFA